MVDRQVAKVADVPHLAGHAVAAAGRRRLLRDHQLFGPDRDPHLAALRLAALSGLDGAARLGTLHQQVVSLALADAALQDVPLADELGPVARVRVFVELSRGGDLHAAAVATGKGPWRGRGGRSV